MLVYHRPYAQRSLLDSCYGLVFILLLFHFRARWGTEPYVALHFDRSFSSFITFPLASLLSISSKTPLVPLRELWPCI